MNVREMWSIDRSSVMVQNAEFSGVPYFGVAKRLDLLDNKWQAHSSMYAGQMDLGVYDSAAGAIAAIVLEAENVLERRARNAEIARGLALGAAAKRITGTGRASVLPPEWERRQTQAADNRKRRTWNTGRSRKVDEDAIKADDAAVALELDHADEATT